LTSALCACGAPPPLQDSKPPVASWTKSAPEGCAIGFSGPTLDPGDALRYARLSALTELVSGHASTTVHVESELLSSAGGQRGGEFTLQEIAGTLRDAKIVAMWAESSEDEHTQTYERHVYALACARGAAAGGLTDPTLPAWILNLPDDGFRACALGVGGPTRDPRDQPDAALRDARRALASTLESELEARIIDTGRRPLIASELQATERALARAEAVTALDDEWLDAAGSGPLGLKATLYGLICVPL
jgi:hypothetical protein